MSSMVYKGLGIGGISFDCTMARQAIQLERKSTGIRPKLSLIELFVI